MTILAIDPGPVQSAWVCYDASGVISHFKSKNADLLDTLRRHNPVPCLVVEKIAAMGMAVGAEVFDTAQWSGRFIEAWDSRGGKWAELTRAQVKMHLCGSMRAKDPNIRAALIDRFGPGKDKAIGKKAAPGPLYGLAGDEWAALAVAVCYADTRTGAGGEGA